MTPGQIDREASASAAPASAAMIGATCTCPSRLEIGESISIAHLPAIQFTNPIMCQTGCEQGSQTRTKTGPTAISVDVALAPHSGHLPPTPLDPVRPAGT